jgi:hypothetical protein
LLDEQGIQDMSQHRFAGLISAQPISSLPLATKNYEGFVVCPLAVQTLGQGQPWQRQVYEKAFREAQAVVRPSILERLQVATNN